MSIIGNNIHGLRLKQGLTLEDLAQKIGTSRQTIQRYEAGVISNIPYDKLSALADALGVAPGDLLNDTPAGQSSRKIAERLQYYLNRSGCSQAEMARRMNVSPQTFNTWMQGIAIPRMEKMDLLAQNLGIRKSDLLDDHDESPTKDFATKLRESLKVAGYSQADAARYMKVTTATVSAWCNGKKLPRPKKILQLADWLGVSKRFFLFDEEEDPDDGHSASIGANIRRAASLAGKTQADVCRDLRFGKNTVSSWFRGERSPRLDNIDLLANYFKVSRTDLLKKSTNPDLLASDARALAYEIVDNPGLMELFIAARKADSEDVAAAVCMLQALRARKGGSQ